MSASSTLVEPAFRTHPPFTRTLGPEVADLADLAGFAPDPEQRMALDLLFATDPTGRAAAFEFALVCSRQNMKTGLFKQAALGWLFLTDQRLVVWSAHEFRTAQEAFRDMGDLIEGSEWLARRLKRIYRGTGDEAIELHNGARLIFKARTRGGGRGLSGDKIVLDEAFALQPMHLGALLPTLSARPDPQVVYGSSAGLVESEVLRAIRDRGRAGDDLRLAYLEWCDDMGGSCADRVCDHGLERQGCRLDDEARWQRSNPAMGRRITSEYIRAERRALPPAEFARERLGWWDEADSGSVIPQQTWEALAEPDSAPGPRLIFALDVSYDRSTAAIAVASVRDDGRMHVEVTDHRPGVDWVAERMLELRRKHRPAAVVVDQQGPGGSLLPDLQKVRVETTTARDMVQACGAFYDLVQSGRLVHMGQEPLNVAIRSARKRQLVDAWAWARRDGDISPLVACTLASWMAAKLGAAKPRVVDMAAALAALDAEEVPSSLPEMSLSPGT